MKLLYTKRSPYARKVNIIALEKGINMEYVEVDLGHKPDELIKANPVGRIPVLILDDGQSLSDSSIICDYLNKLNSEPKLLPDNENDRLRIINLEVLAKGLMDVTVSIFFENILHKDNLNEKFIARREKTIIDCLEYFENTILDLKELSVASIGIASAIGYIEVRSSHLWPQESCPKLRTWYEEFCTRPSMVKTIPVV